MTKEMFNALVEKGLAPVAICGVLESLGERGLVFNPIFRPTMHGDESLEVFAVRFYQGELKVRINDSMWVNFNLSTKGRYNCIDPDILCAFIGAHDIFEK